MNSQQDPAAARLQRIEKLTGILKNLSSGQLFWLEKIINIFDVPGQYEIIRSTLVTKEVLHDFGDALKMHHCFSAEPFTKDKFEYVFAQILRSRGVEAVLAPKGNPGHDITIGKERFSLKTQADAGIREDTILISKFMELGGGKWGDDPSDLVGLLDQFIRHLKNYDRVLTLRTLSKGPDWRYELVEIPKKQLLRAKDGRMEMKLDSTQKPKPGYCYVSDRDGNEVFRIYFDGGGERKLRVQNLKKSICTIHATWGFSIPQI